MRRFLTVASLLFFVSGLFATASHATPGVSEATATKDRLVRPIGRYKAEQNGTTVVAPAHLPDPTTDVTTIGPGSHLLMTQDDAPGFLFSCTANFVWTRTTSTTQTTTTQRTNPKGKPVGKPVTTTSTTTKKTHYLGAAGHCFLPGDDDETPLVDESKTATHGPDADYDPSRTHVKVCVADCQFGGQLGFQLTGTLVDLGPVAYARQTRAGDDLGNDFGIVEIPEDLVNGGYVRPSMPVWGGPSTVEDVAAGDPVCLYGNAGGFGEVFLTKARAGGGEGVSADGHVWSAVLPSFQGDSGSALVTCGPDADGVHGIGAAGILTHIAPGSGGIVGTTPGRAVQMTERDAGITLKLKLEDGSEVAPTQPPVESAITPDEPVHAVAEGGQHAWTAGPFTRSAPPEAIFFGDQCAGKGSKTDFCDYEFVELSGVPSDGSLLRVTVSTADPAATDFDLFVFGPDGELVAPASASAGTPPEEVTAVVKQNGTYTIAVDPYEATDASYNGVAALEDYDAPPPPPVATLTGDPHIYQGGAIDPSGLTGLYAVAPGEPVGLSVRTLKSNSGSVVLAIDAGGNANFAGVHKITKDGQVVHVFDAVEASELDPVTDEPVPGEFRTDNDWTVPADAEPGSYVFEAYVTVGGQTYMVTTLPFDIL